MKQVFMLLLLIVALMMTVAVPSAYGQTYHSSGVRRGAYLSLWSDRIGSLYLETTQGGDLYRILGNATKEQMVLNFMKNWKFNAVVFYNMYKIWTTPDLANRLGGFMESCRSIGITNIEVATSKWTVDYDELEKWNNQKAQNDNQRFDGLVTEIEFWSSGKISEMTEALTYAAGKNITVRAGKKKLYVCAYLGWVQRSHVETLQPMIDYFWPHAYDKKISTFYPKTQERLGFLVDKQGKSVTGDSIVVDKQGKSVTGDSIVKVTPIFSMESKDYNACGSACAFAGDALRERGNFHSIEQEYKDAWKLALASNPSTAPPIELLTGYQWYEYVFFYLMMWDKPVPGGTNSTNAPTNPPASTTVAPPSPPTAAAAATPQQTPPSGPTPEPEPLRCTSSDDCLCSGTWCKDNGFCGGPPCHISTTTAAAGLTTTLAPAAGSPTSAAAPTNSLNPTTSPPQTTGEAEPLMCTVTEDCLCPGTWCKANGYCGGAPCHVPQTAGGVVYVKGVFRIAGNFFDVSLNDTKKKAELELAVRTDLSRILELEIRFIRIDSLELGSLVVSYSTMDHGRSVDETNDRIRNHQDRGGLRMTQRVYTNHTGSSERLAVTDTTTEDGTVRGKSLCGSGLAARDCAAVLIGSGVALLLVGLVGCVCCVFHSRRTPVASSSEEDEETSGKSPFEEDEIPPTAQGTRQRTLSGPAGRKQNPVTIFDETEEDGPSPPSSNEPYSYDEEEHTSSRELHHQEDENDNDTPQATTAEEEEQHEGEETGGGEQQQHQYVLDESTGYYKYVDPTSGKRYLYDAESGLYYDDDDDHGEDGGDE